MSVVESWFKQMYSVSVAFICSSTEYAIPSVVVAVVVETDYEDVRSSLYNTSTDIEEIFISAREFESSSVYFDTALRWP